MWSPVTHQASPGVIAGCTGLVLAVLAMATEQVWLAGAAGVAALAAGLFTLGLADRLQRARAEADEAVHVAEEARLDSDLMAARAARFEAEARTARSEAGVDLTTAAGIRTAPTAADLSQVTDQETGLFNTAYFAVTIDKRVCAARRGLRPLALALLEPVSGVAEGMPRPALGPVVTGSLTETLRDSDVACRLQGGLVAVILEDTPENGAVWTVERVRRRVAAAGGDVTLRAGIACYPAHAFDAEQLMSAAMEALRAARDWHQDRIEVAALPDD